MNDFNNSKINYIVFKPKDLGENLGLITRFFSKKLKSFSWSRFRTDSIVFQYKESKYNNNILTDGKHIQITNYKQRYNNNILKWN